MRAIEHIRQLIEKDVFDYTQLMHVLAEYSKPRDAVSSLRPIVPSYHRPIVPSFFHHPLPHPRSIVLSSYRSIVLSSYHLIVLSPRRLVAPSPRLSFVLSFYRSLPYSPNQLTQLLSVRSSGFFLFFSPFPVFRNP